jgi:hypothetical protein
MSETVIEEYPDGSRIVHEERMYPDLYHFEREGEIRLKSFKNPDKARLYADLYEVVDGFKEDNTGTRGVPPTIARDREEIRMAYFTATMSSTYAAGAFEVEESEVLTAVYRVRERAKTLRSQQTSDE